MKTRPAVISGREFAAGLEHHGFDFFTGVPVLADRGSHRGAEAGARQPYVAAVREDSAVGLAAGAWLGGRRPVVLMQNSGLGTSLNALASLSLMYGFPALLLVTWRGFGGKDAPEHILMGEISPKLLELLGMPYRVLAADSLERDLAWARAEMESRDAAGRVLVPPGRGDRRPCTPAPSPGAAPRVARRARDPAPRLPVAGDVAPGGAAASRSRPWATIPSSTPTGTSAARASRWRIAPRAST